MRTTDDSRLDRETGESSRRREARGREVRESTQLGLDRGVGLEPRLMGWFAATRRTRITYRGTFRRRSESRDAQQNTSTRCGVLLQLLPRSFRQYDAPTNGIAGPVAHGTSGCAGGRACAERMHAIASVRLRADTHCASDARRF